MGGKTADFAVGDFAGGWCCNNAIGKANIAVT